MKKLYLYNGPTYNYYGYYAGEVVDTTWAISPKQARRNIEYRYHCRCLQDCVYLVEDEPVDVQPVPTVEYKSSLTILIHEDGYTIAIVNGVELERWRDDE